MPQVLTFKDYFSGGSDAYEKYRPSQAPGLFAWLAALAPGKRLAIDVATGNGQAALGLAELFDAVIASDASAAQLASARPHARIEYRHEPAEALSVEAQSADLLVAAQAAHWFDWQAFCAEARRVLRPGGLFAIWSYGQFTATSRIERMIAEFSRDVVGPYWPRERRHVDEGYDELKPPFPAVAAPQFEMLADWDCGSALGYLGTWSAVVRYRGRCRRDPLELIAKPLAEAWGPGRRRLAWPLTLRAARA
jgi:ubiquinone/menaquinone biosynthesis C-methylase UbiE